MFFIRFDLLLTLLADEEHGFATNGAERGKNIEGIMFLTKEAFENVHGTLLKEPAI
jgi:hypothetical protein